MSDELRRAFGAFLLGMIGIPLAAATATADTEPTPRQIFEQRIMPIFKSPNPSSCTQCHLAGVELKKYIIPSTAGKTDGHEKTFLSLRDQGLIDLAHPEKSKILEFIQKREKNAGKDAVRIHEKVRQVEFDAFAAWIKESCKDDRLRNAPRVKATELARPDRDPEVIRYTRKDRLLESFEKNIWSMRFRCISCHGEEDSKPARAYVAKYGGRVSWIKKEGAAATMNYLISTGRLIDVKNPERSLLLLKATGEVPHVGGGKLAKPLPPSHPKQVQAGDLGYKGFRGWLEDYAKVVNGEYKDVAGLPRKKESFHEYGTDIRLRFLNVPVAWAQHLVQVNVYAWDADRRAWEKDPVATTDGIPGSGAASSASMSLNLIAEKGSERDRRWQGKDDLLSLPGQRYLLKVYVDRSDRIARDWKQNMREEDYVGQMELDGELPGEAVLADAQRIAWLIRELDDDDFAVRERATRELEKLGQAVPALCQASRVSPSPEVRHRAAKVLEKLNPARIDARLLK